MEAHRDGMIEDMVGIARRRRFGMVKKIHLFMASIMLVAILVACSSKKIDSNLEGDRSQGSETSSTGLTSTGMNGAEKGSAGASGVSDKDSEQLENIIEALVNNGHRFYDAEGARVLPSINIDTSGKKIGDKAIEALITLNIDGTAVEKLAPILYSGSATIKLRGNSTRYRDKAPYKLKLESKNNLLGLGRSKHWVLLAEDIDHTLSRNYLTLKLARDIGIKTAGSATSIELYLNGKYRGVYTLCEQVRIGEDQVDVYDWNKLAKKLAKGIAGKIISSGQSSTGVSESASGQGSTGASESASGQGSAGKSQSELEDELEEIFTADYGWLSAPYMVEYEGKKYKATDFVEIPALNGGVLLEADFYHQGAAADSVKTAYLQPFYLSEPETLASNKELMDNLRKYIQSFEYALHARDFIYHETGSNFEATTGRYNPKNGWSGDLKAVTYSDPEHDGWRYDDFFDMESLVNNFLICEITRNWDGMKNSMFIYKDIDSKAYMAPVWDFDWAYGNINMFGIDTYFIDGWATTDNNYIREQYYQQFNWNRQLIKDEVFVKAVFDKWQEIRPTVIEDLVKEGGDLDILSQELTPYGKNNDLKWGGTYRYYGGKKYQESWDLMKKYIRARVHWMDQQFKNVDVLYDSLNQ